MIYIKEIENGYLGGNSSINISFNYNKEIIDIIKTCSVCNYDKATKTWEITINDLAYIIDNLTYFDDITIDLIDNSTKYEKPLEGLIESFTPLYDHQVEGIKYFLKHNKGLLLDEPGLGKSLQAITIAQELKKRENLQHCLIICGINSLKQNWKKEIQKHSDLSCIIIGEKISKKGNISYTTIKERINQLNNKIEEFFIIINIESIRDDGVVKALINNNFDMIVFDELHKAKNPESIQGSNLLKLTANHLIGMTGTPIINSPIDCYLPLAWIGKERKHNITRFKNTFCNFDSNNSGRVLSFKNMNLLKEELESCSIRRTKDMLKDLPSKTIIDEYLDMNDSHKKFYDDVKKGVKKECDKIKLKTNNLLSLIIRLRQATSCPQLLTSKAIMSTKIERCIELIEEIISNGDKVVIMSSFKEPVYQLGELLKEYKPLINTGDIKDDIVSKNVDIFQEDNEHKIFIATTDKCGTGITLNKASYMIMIDEPWTFSLYQQVTDRIHRINNTRPVFIYNLICNDTIDETVANVINRKHAIGDYIVDDKIENDKSLSILQKYIEDI